MPVPQPPSPMNRLTHELSILRDELAHQHPSPHLPAQYTHQKTLILNGLGRLESKGRHEIGLCVDAVQAVEAAGLSEEEKAIRENFEHEVERMVGAVVALRKGLQRVGKLERGEL